MSEDNTKLGSLNYNWRNTLGDYAAISGVLAGFSVALIGIVLSWSIAETCFFSSFTFGQMSVLFFSIATVLFISASQFFLHAKAHELFSCQKDYIIGIRQNLSSEWNTLTSCTDKKLKLYYNFGRKFYNFALFTFYFGVLFLVIPYNLYIAIISFIIGVIIESYQLYIEKKRTFGILKKNIKKILIIILVVIVILCTVAFAAYYSSSQGYLTGFNDGADDVVDNINYNEELMINISRIEIKEYFQQAFNDKQNFTQLLSWESKILTYSNSSERHISPIEIAQYHYGRCGEFSILYTAICLANDIPARLVSPAKIITGELDHVWVEINPLKDDETWIMIDPTGACSELQKNKMDFANSTHIDYPKKFEGKYSMILAFELAPNDNVVIIDRTNYYNPN